MILLALLLIVGIKADSWLVCPPSFSPVVGRTIGERVGPCDGGRLDQPSPPVTPIQVGQRLKVGWPSNNHAGGFVRISLVPEKDSEFPEAFDENVLKLTCFGHDQRAGRLNYSTSFCNHPCNGRPGCHYQRSQSDRERYDTSVGIPTNLEEGIYVLQWKALIGDDPLPLYSCSKLFISGGKAGANCSRPLTPQSLSCYTDYRSNPKSLQKLMKDSIFGKFCHAGPDPSNVDGTISSIPPANRECDPRTGCLNAEHKEQCLSEVFGIENRERPEQNCDFEFGATKVVEVPLMRGLGEILNLEDVELPDLSLRKPLPKDIQSVPIELGETADQPGEVVSRGIGLGLGLEKAQIIDELAVGFDLNAPPPLGSSRPPLTGRERNPRFPLGSRRLPLTESSRLFGRRLPTHRIGRRLSSRPSSSSSSYRGDRRSPRPWRRRRHRCGCSTNGTSDDTRSFSRRGRSSNSGTTGSYRRYRRPRLRRSRQSRRYPSVLYEGPAIAYATIVATPIPTPTPFRTVQPQLPPPVFIPEFAPPMPVTPFMTPLPTTPSLLTATVTVYQYFPLPPITSTLTTTLIAAASSFIDTSTVTQYLPVLLTTTVMPFISTQTVELPGVTQTIIRTRLVPGPGSSVTVYGPAISITTTATMLVATTVTSVQFSVVTIAQPPVTTTWMPTPMPTGIPMVEDELPDIIPLSEAPFPL